MNIEDFQDAALALECNRIQSLADFGAEVFDGGDLRVRMGELL